MEKAERPGGCAESVARTLTHLDLPMRAFDHHLGALPLDVAGVAGALTHALLHHVQRRQEQQRVDGHAERLADTHEVGPLVHVQVHAVDSHAPSLRQCSSDDALHLLALARPAVVDGVLRDDAPAATACTTRHAAYV